LQRVTHWSIAILQRDCPKTKNWGAEADLASPKAGRR
jgi:hypothetical protein